MITGNEDLTVQFGEDPPESEHPPLDRAKANKELEDKLIFDSWTCRFCGVSYADRKLAIKHAIECADNEDNRTCSTCVYYGVKDECSICRANPDRVDMWVVNCPDWKGEE